MRANEGFGMDQFKTIDTFFHARSIRKGCDNILSREEALIVAEGTIKSYF